MTISTTISDLARILSAGYPQAAASYHREVDNLRWVREHQPNEARQREKHRELVSAVSAECEQYRLALLELVQLVRIHLPDVYPRLLIVPNAGPWHNDPSFDWQAAVVELRTVEAAAAGRVAGGDHDQDVEPVTWLLNWREIVDALPGREHNETDRNLITKMNRQLNGPIIFQGQGSQPFCNRTKLLDWWNRFEELHKELQDQDRDERLAVAEQ